MGSIKVSEAVELQIAYIISNNDEGKMTATMNIIEQINAEQATRELPEFNPGDTVIVSVKVKEGSRERLQAFEGVVIAKKNRGINSAFTVRKISVSMFFGGFVRVL